MSQVKTKSLSVALLLAFVGLVLLNVSALVAVEIGDVDPVPVDYKMKLVANGVYHCTTSGSYGCDTPSSHAWYPKPR